MTFSKARSTLSSPAAFAAAAAAAAASAAAAAAGRRRRHRGGGLATGGGGSSFCGAGARPPPPPRRPDAPASGSSPSGGGRGGPDPARPLAQQRVAVVGHQLRDLRPPHGLVAEGLEGLLQSLVEVARVLEALGDEREVLVVERDGVADELVLGRGAGGLLGGLFGGGGRGRSGGSAGGGGCSLGLLAPRRGGVLGPAQEGVALACCCLFLEGGDDGGRGRRRRISFGGKKGKKNSPRSLALKNLPPPQKKTQAHPRRGP